LPENCARALSLCRTAAWRTAVLRDRSWCVGAGPQPARIAV